MNLSSLPNGMRAFWIVLAALVAALALATPALADDDTGTTVYNYYVGCPGYYPYYPGYYGGWSGWYGGWGYYRPYYYNYWPYRYRVYPRYRYGWGTGWWR